jgi:hypothetical protein
MPEEESDWTKGLVSKSPVSAAGARAKSGATGGVETSLTKSYSDGSESTRKVAEMAKQYKWGKKNVKPIERVDSTILKDGWARGTYTGIIGPPGGGKSRLLLQEVFAASKRGQESLYMYNEFIQDKFDQFINKATDELDYNEDDLSNISWVDMCQYDLGIAGHDEVKSFFKRKWLSQITYWLDNIKTEPGFLVIDSFSALARRYVPWMWMFQAILLDLLAVEFERLKIKPVVFLVHQKSQSSREKNDDSTVGGFGIVHELDSVVIMGLHIVDVWGSRRYGWPEGTVQHTIHSTKDRYGSELDQERMMVMNNGKLTLGIKVSDLVAQQQALIEAKEAEKAARYKSRSSDSQGEAVTAEDVWSQ